MSALLLFHQKVTLEHRLHSRLGIFEMIVWRVPVTKFYPEGIRYRAWLSQDGETVFGFDNHKPKGPHLHIGSQELSYLYRGVDALMADIRTLIEKMGYLYEV